MKYIFTLSGNSKRFTDEGFISKPLIKIDGKMVIEYVTDMFKDINFADVTFIINNRDVELHHIDEILKSLYLNSKIVIIPQHSSGPVISILNIENVISDSEPYIVSYCDLTHKWDFNAFLKHISETNCDGCLVTHTGKHPHRLKNINFAHLKIQDHRVLEVKEKGYYTNSPIDEQASSGIYYFKSGNLLKRYFKRLVENKEIVNGEFYVTLVYNQMIRDGLNVTYYLTQNYVCLGTPFDLIQFKYWTALIKNKFSDEEIEFIKSYWKDYNSYTE